MRDVGWCDIGDEARARRRPLDLLEIRLKALSLDGARRRERARAALRRDAATLIVLCLHV